jgi:hypothetical protein
MNYLKTAIIMCNVKIQHFKGKSMKISIFFIAVPKLLNRMRKNIVGLFTIEGDEFVFVRINANFIRSFTAS